MRVVRLNDLQSAWLLLTALLIGGSGYWLRFSAPLPPEWRDHAGGIAYVVFWIVILALLVQTISPWRAALIVLFITCSVEFAQLWHPAWLERIRRTFLGRVVLGTTFDWSDFPPYFLGAVLGWLLLEALQWAFRRQKLYRVKEP